MYAAAASACAPLLDVVNARRLASSQVSCLQFNEAVAEAIERLDPRLIILNAYWAFNSDLMPIEDRVPPRGEPALRWGLEQTIRRINNGERSICVVADVPTLQYVVPQALAMALRREIPADFIGISREAATQQSSRVDEDLNVLAARGLLTVADPKVVLCGTDRCEFEYERRAVVSRHQSSIGGRRGVRFSRNCVMLRRAVAPPQGSQPRLWNHFSSNGFEDTPPARRIGVREPHRSHGRRPESATIALVVLERCESQRRFCAHLHGVGA